MFCPSISSFAVALSKFLVAKQWDRQLHPILRTWAYMPFMHSETLADQLKCIELFEQLIEDPVTREHGLADNFRVNLKFAAMHKEIIEKFGRYGWC